MQVFEKKSFFSILFSNILELPRLNFFTYKLSMLYNNTRLNFCLRLSLGSDKMKIEKINENQIRCTLTKEDLEIHQIRISELAYGTEKAKKLFRDMMQEAQIQFGFEANNIPLMIEAIPISPESIVLIITKVEDPEELDTRFSKFSPFKDQKKPETLQLDGADNILDVFHKLSESKSKEHEQESSSPSEKETNSVSENEEVPSVPTINLLRLYMFSSLDDVIEAAHGLNGYFDGKNILYKDSVEGLYQLVLHQSSYSPEDFNKICNILSEYGKGSPLSEAGEAYLMEHSEPICSNALQQLNQL